MKNIFSFAVLPSAAFCAFSAAAPAWAQDTAKPAGTPQAAVRESIPGEIIVTAQKKSERLGTVPAAVTAVSSTQLTTAGVVTTRDLASQIPSLETSGGFASGSFVLRGLNTGEDSIPTVGTQIDGAPIGASTFGSGGANVLPQIDPSTIGRVEVLRGPQGTVYAGNTLGGIVSYVTTDPSLRRTQGSFYLEGSDTDGGGGNFVAHAMVTAPLVEDQLGFQVSGFVNRQSGFIDATTVGRQKYDFNHDYGGRAALLWQVTPNFRIKLSDLYSDVKSYLDAVLADPATGRPVGPDLTDAQRVLPRYDNRFNVAILNADLDVGDSKLSYVGTLQSARSFWAIDLAGSAFSGILQVLPAFGGAPVSATDGIAAQTLQGMHKVTQELRFSSPDRGRLRWLFGAFYSHERAYNDQTEGVLNPDQSQASGPAGDLLNYNFTTHLTEYAGFGNLTYYLTPKLDVTGGIRVSRINQDSREFFFGSDATAYNTLFTVLGFNAQPADTGVEKAGQTVKNYLANVRYTFSPDTMAYFRFSTGFRVGGPNALTQGLPATFGPDTTDNYEIGLKSSLLDKKLYVELTIYDVEWRNIQAITVGAGGTSGTINGGRATSRGFEGNLTARPTDGLTVSAWLNYSDAKLDDNIITGAGTVGLKGDRLPNSPKWSGALSGEYQRPINGELTGFVGGAVHYNGAREAVFANSTVYAHFRMPSYVVGDLRAGLRYHDYELAVFARNVGNARAELAVTTLGTPQVILQRPRTFGASLSAKF